MSELGVDVAVFTIVVATFMTIFCKIKVRKNLKRMKEELVQAKASLSSAETEISELNMALGEKSKQLSG